MTFGACAALADVLGMRAQWLANLPVLPTLIVSVRRQREITIDFHRHPSEGAFDSRDWIEIIRGAQSGRVGARELLAWAKTKHTGARWWITWELATAGLGRCPNLDESWIVGRVLGAYDAELRFVVLEDGGDLVWLGAHAGSASPASDTRAVGEVSGIAKNERSLRRRIE